MSNIQLDLNAIEALNRRLIRAMEYEKSRSGPPEGFPALPEIPGGRYTDPAFLEAEWQALWKRSWLYACHADELPDPGSYMVWKNTGSPILIVRGDDGVIRAFYNTCRHRGAPLVMDDGGNARHIALTPGLIEHSLDRAECCIDCEITALEAVQARRKNPLDLFYEGQIRITGDAQIALAMAGLFL